MKYLLLVLLLVGCGAGEDQFRYPGLRKAGWDEGLGRIAVSFIEDAVSRGLPTGRLGAVTTIRADTPRVEALQDGEGKLLGICRQWGLGQRDYRAEIYIREGITSENYALERLMYHELTHCAYEQDHFGERGDIMFASLNSTIFDWDVARDRHFLTLGEQLRQ